MDFLKIKRGDQTILEVAKFIIALFWGSTLLLPGDSFGSTKTFVVMSKIAPEMVWGLFPIILFVFYVVFRKSVRARKITLISLMIFWLLIACSTFIANPLSTATTAYFGYAFLTAISYLRVGGE